MRGIEPQNEVDMFVLNTAPKLFGMVSATVLTVALAGHAYADRRSPAPIVYGGTTGVEHPRSQTQTPRAQQYAAATPQPSDVTDKTRRIEFRYPDQPDTFYGEGGARRADTSMEPIAFSSAKAAINVNAARQYTGQNPQQIARDPAISAGGFDARAAAAQVEAEVSNSVKPIRITATSPKAAQPLGRPVTLSRTNVRDGATISEESGYAGAYGDGFDGQPTANGEIFDRTAMSAAHPTLPLPSLVQVINTQNGREIVVRVNDRGPFAGDRIIDLSEHAAKMLGYKEGEKAAVKVRYLGPAPTVAAPSFASQDVSIESLPAFTPTPQDAAFDEPTLGVPDPVDAMPLPAPVKIAGPGTGNIFVQAGSFADISNAQTLNAALGRNMPVEIQQARVRGADYFRVMIGPFATRQQAETYRAHLAENEIANGIVVKR